MKYWLLLNSPEYALMHFGTILICLILLVLIKIFKKRRPND